MMAEKEFRINDHIILKLEEGKTNIYIDNKLFRQCKHLFLINPAQKSKQSEIESIDDAATILRSDLEKEITPHDIGLTAEEEFWGHCSNLQAWSENEYDSKLMYYNLAFPLLKRLTKKKIVKELKYKEEIFKRLRSRNDIVVKFLLEDYYVQGFTNEELLFNILNIEEYLVLKKIFTESINKLNFKIGRLDNINVDQDVFNIGITNGRIKDLTLENMDLKTFPEDITHLQFLEKIWLGNNRIKYIPRTIIKLKQLNTLDLYHNNISKIPMELFSLENLTVLDLSYNRIKQFPKDILRLQNLKNLRINGNPLITSKKKIGEILKGFKEFIEIVV